MNLIVPALLVSCLSCQSVHGPASVDVNAGLVSQYNFRGVPQNAEGALQSDVNVSLPTGSDGTLDINVWSNWDLSNGTGDAAFPDGNGGKLSEIDLAGSWSKEFESVSFTAGLVSYNLPNGVGGSTTELFASFGWDAWYLSPSVTVYHDFGEVEGSYINASISRGLKLNESTSADLSLGLGFTDKDHGLAYYGASESGLADLLLTASVAHAYDEKTTLGAFISISQIIDSDLEDGVEASGIDPDNTWVGFSIGWSF